MSRIVQPRPSRRVAKPRHRGLARRRRRNRVTADIAGLLVFAVMAFPVYWMVASAIKPSTELRSTTPRFIPSEFSLDSFRRAIDQPHFWDAVMNSMVVGAGVVLASVAVGFLAALAVARFRFYGRKAFLVVVISVQMIPLNALVIPLFLLLQEADLTNTLIGVVTTYLALTLPLTIWLLRGFIAGIPRELEEAAMVDGCSRMGAFFRIVLPLVAPGLVAVSIFGFIQAWNEFLLANVLLTVEDKRTISLWLLSFSTVRGTDYGAIMAGSTLVALPVVVLFLVINRRIAAGLVAGAVKG